MIDGTASQPDRPVLIVEDERPMRHMIQSVLEDEGLEVETAANGVEALQVAARNQPCAVVLDMSLPLLNGDGVASGLRDLYSERIPIVLITADGRAAEKARLVGAADYLQKPFNIDDLISAVWRLIA